MSEGRADIVNCPLCGAQCPAEIIDEHVNLHFEEQSLREDKGQLVIEDDCFEQEEDDKGVLCHLCGEFVDIHDLDSHEEAHRSVLHS